jgi:hypothetical protein
LIVYHKLLLLSTVFLILLFLLLSCFSTATFISYHSFHILSTTFFISFKNSPAVFSRWNYNITLLNQYVKGICTIFLNNFK